jgi:ABC-2 type transport system permease protein
MWAIVVKEFRELRRDRRTLAMMLAVPFLFLVVFGYAASFDVKQVRVAVSDTPAIHALAEDLPAFLDVTEYLPPGRQPAAEALRDGRASAALWVDGQGDGGILVDGEDLFSAQAVLRQLQVLQTQVSQAPATVSAPSLTAADVEILFNPELRTAPVMVPAITGLILVFVGTLATALGVVRERQAGTMEQLAVMPFRPRDVFVGKIAPYLLVAAIDMVLVVLAGVWLFDVPFGGSVLVFALGAGLFLFVTLGTGVLISTVSQTQGQAMQLGMMTIVPQILLSGFAFPVYSMAAGVRWLAYVLPLTYFIRIARGVWVKGTPLDALWFPLLMLAILGAAVFSLSLLRFRRDLAPARRGVLRAERRKEGDGGGRPPSVELTA